MDLKKKASEKIGQLIGKKKHKEGSRASYPSITLNDPTANSSKDFPTNAVRSTKYTVVTYAPKLLWEQFRKLTSWYFLAVLIISCIPSISPITPWTTLAGFVFIIGVAAIREAYEDFLRYLADVKVNDKPFFVAASPSGVLSRTKSRDIAVGEIVCVEQNEPIPADLLLLASPTDGTCYLETAQLDGETNLKARRAPDATACLRREELTKLRGRVDVETPHHSLYVFKGRLSLYNDDANDGDAIPLNENNLLLKGAILKNTTWILGLVIYAGPETKQALNQKSPPSKMSTLDKKMNFYVSAILVIQLVLCVVMAIGSVVLKSKLFDDSWYLRPESLPADGFEIGIATFFTYFALLSYLIPVSLLVSLEVIKIVQSKFMEWDEQMSTETNTMTAKTSNLNDELGLVEYVFSDKTGTLTENIMKLSKCSVSGSIYDSGSLGTSWNSKKGTLQGDVITEFLLMMSLCHAAVPELDPHQPDNIRYRASSPDEEALVQAAAENGFRFTSRNSTQAILHICGTMYEFEVLDMMEFTSSRRRMSVIVKTPEGRIVLWTKGADSVVKERLSPENSRESIANVDQHLHEFSINGLRTLLFARKQLSNDEFEIFHREYQAARSSLGDREAEMEKVSDKIERDLIVVGATAIEDKLQHNVPETIEYLLHMGIKVWMITGDKQETAVNIGYSTRLLKNTNDSHRPFTIATINASSSHETYQLLNEWQQRRKEMDPKQEFAIVIDGATLKYVINDHPREFLSLATNCHSVICCRVTPLQKAKIVKLVKDSTNATCLAIGDGGNDVSMIQEAQVGVGIVGNEGTQAARASDFAIPRFHCLQRLLAVHGRYSLVRSAGVIHYSLYKNSAIFLVQIWFSFYSGFSGQTLYDEWIMTLFNMTITALPPVIYGVFEKDIGEKLINTHPQIYNRTQSKKIFTKRTLCLWLLLALYHSLVLFYGTKWIFEKETIWKNGQIAGLTLIGNITMSVGLIVIFLQLAIETGYWTIITQVAYWGSLIVYFVTLAIQSAIISFFPDQFAIFQRMVSSPLFWLWALLAVVVCLAPYLLLKSLQRMYWPEDWQVLQHQYYEAKKRGKGHEMVSETAFPTNKTPKNQSLFSDELQKPFLDTDDYDDQS